MKEEPIHKFRNHRIRQSIFLFNADNFSYYFVVSDSNNCWIDVVGLSPESYCFNFGEIINDNVPSRLKKDTELKNNLIRAVEMSRKYLVLL